jgi:hypothetical protein
MALPTVFKCMISSFQDVSLLWVHSGCLLGGDSEKRSIKGSWIICYEMGTFGVELHSNISIQNIAHRTGRYAQVSYPVDIGFGIVE